MQQLPDLENTASKEEISNLEWTKFNGRRSVCVNFQTDTDRLDVVVYSYWNSLYFKNFEVDMKLTEYQSLLSRQVCLLSCIDTFDQQCIILDETTVHN